MIARASAKLLPPKPEHAEASATLGAMHGDPVDRMLVGTALAKGVVPVTHHANILELAKPILGDLLLEA